MLSVSTQTSGIAQQPVDVTSFAARSPQVFRRRIVSTGRPSSPMRSLQNDLLASAYINSCSKYKNGVAGSTDNLKKSRHSLQVCTSSGSSQAIPSIRVETHDDCDIRSSVSSIARLEICHDTGIPDRVLDGILDWQSPVGKDDCRRDEQVSLPERYREVTSVISSSQESDQQQTAVGDDLEDREKDLGEALKWIRQQIVEMKEQDKSLLKQFIDLRSSILQLRCYYDLHSSCSDLSSLDGSTFSLNESVKTPEVRRLVIDHDMYLKPSISLPSSPRVARFKWTSEDFI